MKGKGWYVLGTVFILIGLVPGTISMIWGIMGLTDNLQQGFQRVVVPGTGELQLRESGEYTVFHEYKSQMDGEKINSQCANLSEYKFHLHPKDRPEQKIHLETASGNRTYDFFSRKGISTYSFQIREPGTYIFVGRRKKNGDDDCERAVLAIGQGVVMGFILNMFKAVGGGCFLLFFTGGGLIILLVTYFNRTGEDEEEEPLNQLQ